MKIMNRLIILTAFLTGLSLTGAAQIKPEMVLVEGGNFQMGNSGSASPKGDPDERPVHNVTVKSFYISKYELTVKEYKQFIAEKESATDFSNLRNHKMPSAPDSTWLAEHPDTKKHYPMPTQKWWGWGEDLPMFHITWYDAVSFCNWLSAKEGLQKCYSMNADGGIEVDINKNGYRLPTEAEWEYAARGGNKSKKTLYSGSSSPSSVCWYDETTALKGPKKVGTKAPNELGIYDMCGNVWEWCSDFYAKDYYAKCPKSNPINLNISPYRVIRGGSWHYNADYATLTSRDGPEPQYTNYNYGMRLCKTADK